MFLCREDGDLRAAALLGKKRGSSNRGGGSGEAKREDDEEIGEWLETSCFGQGRGPVGFFWRRRVRPLVEGEGQLGFSVFDNRGGDLSMFFLKRAKGAAAAFYFVGFSGLSKRKGKCQGAPGAKKIKEDGGGGPPCK